jgi:hypothetical protein
MAKTKKVMVNGKEMQVPESYTADDIKRLGKRVASQVGHQDTGGKTMAKKIPRKGPFLQTARAKATPGQTVAPGGTQVIQKKGQPPMAFKKGGLHEVLGVPQGQPIPADKVKKALAGDYGPKVKRMAVFAFRGALAKGRKTASKP